MIREGQSIYDICIQNFGTLESIFDFLTPNNLNFSSKLQSGIELTIDNEKKGTKRVKDYFIINGIFVNNQQITGGAFSQSFGTDFNI